MIDEFYAREGQEATNDARQLLDAAGVDYTSHVEFGHAATEIAGYARDHGCARIVMGTRGNGTLANILIGSVANQVLQLAEAPVTLVK